MFGSQIIDVAIAMIVFYLFISLICSAVREGIESITKTRAMNIERAIRELLDDPDGTQITKALFDHPQLSGLFQGSYDPGALARSFFGRAKAIVGGNMGYWGRANLPSYIPASNFAIALLDITAKRATGDRSQPAPPPGQLLSLDAVRSSIAQLPTSQVQRAMQDAVDRANGDLAQAQKNLENWFNSAMDRVTGWYKRRTQLILFLLGLGAAVFLNLDTFAQLDAASSEKTLRDGMVAMAGKVEKSDPKTVEMMAKEMKSLDVQMGWGNCTNEVETCIPRPIPQSINCKEGACDRWPSFWGIVKMILGWLITAAAVTLGAPFWFDTLSKFMSVRSALKPDDKASPSGAAAAPAPGAGSGARPPGPPPEPFVPNAWSTGDAQAGVL
jgi:hypothetical protein